MISAYPLWEYRRNIVIRRQPTLSPTFCRHHSRNFSPEWLQPLEHAYLSMSMTLLINEIGNIQLFFSAGLHSVLGLMLV